MQREHIHFVTGRLAEKALNKVLESLAPQAGFDHSVDVLPITVAALMTPLWIARHIQAPQHVGRIVIPGYCAGDLQPIAAATGIRTERGPCDLWRLPDFFGQPAASEDYGQYAIEIIAEINHCPRLTLQEIVDEAERLRADGADLIDVGCDPGGPWPGVAETVRALKDAGHRVSIDSFDPAEVEPAIQAGAELVLSVDSSNRELATGWAGQVEVVVVPDDPQSLSGLDETIAVLAGSGISFRVDPVLEPLGMGLAPSLGRFIDIRRRYPDAEMMMGIGNVTELTDVDSAGVNVMLIGFCEELGIRSVLTTQVINWARSSVRECDLARRLVHYAVRHRTIPKHLEPQLVTLRDVDLSGPGVEELEELSREIKDNNYRLYAHGGRIHLLSAGLHLAEADPFLLFERLMRAGPGGGLPKNLSVAHAFYLGYEMCKAATAIDLSKQYRQDESLDWGFLTRRESFHRIQQRREPGPRDGRSSRG